MAFHPPLWPDRHHAGVALAKAVAQGSSGFSAASLLLALPRGGVPVTAAMATNLGLPLATWSVRKIADPAWPELAVGAVAAGGVVVWRNGEGARRRATTATQHGWLREQERELSRRQHLFRDPPGDSLRGRCLIVVDDGIATGMTVHAALLSLRRCAPASITLASPVVAQDVAGELGRMVDRMVALAIVDDLRGVGLWYEHFDQLSDEQVLALLLAADH